MLTLATAAIHIGYAFPTAKLIGSGIGYLLLLGAFVAPPLRRFRGAFGAALAVFAVGNIGAWLMQGPRVPLAYFDKAVEATLLAVLLAYLVVSRRDRLQPVRVLPPHRRS